MDSDVEMNAASDEEVTDDEDYYDYCYSDAGDDGSGGGDSEGELVAGDYDEGLEAEGTDEVVSRREQTFAVLSEEDISERQEEDISKVSAVLSINREEACVLLHHYKWNISKLSDEWFADEEKVRHTVGLLLNGNDRPRLRKLTCGICFEGYSSDMMSSAGCAHFYCHECWEGYISAAISGGPGCLSLRCPDPSCDSMVLQGMVNKLAKDEDKEKYARFLLRAYVEGSKKTKWCPAPDCTCAVEFLGDENYDVLCNCKFNFCWNCTEEAHRPVNCETVSKWILKNSAESEHMNWILANSKPCPKCKRPIEKNQGCMHMTCTPPCKFEFCWLCLGAWSDHGERTGGFYACNRYESAKKEGVYDETEARRERAKNSLERYMHYYERWASNQTSRQKAQADLHKVEKEQLAKLTDIFGIPETQLKFIIEAWSQIIECRRVLKWTYAYGYYLDDKVKSEFFEYLQGEAESGLERLHQCAEKDLQAFLPSLKPDSNETMTSSVADFGDFRVKLAGLTSVTRNYFENLVRALEAGLEDVRAAGQAGATSSTATSSKKGGTKSKKKQHSKPSSDHTDDSWPCERCTYRWRLFAVRAAGRDSIAEAAPLLLPSLPPPSPASAPSPPPSTAAAANQAIRRAARPSSPPSPRPRRRPPPTGCPALPGWRRSLASPSAGQPATSTGPPPPPAPPLGPPAMEAPATRNPKVPPPRPPTRPPAISPAAVPPTYHPSPANPPAAVPRPLLEEDELGAPAPQRDGSHRARNK